MNRDNRGRFADSKVNKWFVIRFIGFPVLCVTFGLSLATWYSCNHPKVITNTVTIDNSGINFAQKIDSLEKDVVQSIRSCESGGKKESDGLIIFDTNKVASIGTLQWQVKSVIYYEKSLYGKVITGKEAILVALDDNQSGQLAQDVLFSTKDGWKNWLNCSNRMSLESQINAIKKIK